MKNKILLLLAGFSFTAVLSRAQVFTNYTLPADTTNVGTFSLSSTRLDGINRLSTSGGATYHYAYAVFTPAVSGTYSFGIESANFDPVMILYSGATSFPANPSTNAVALNDDGGLEEFHGLSLANSDDPTLNPIIPDFNLVSGTSYLVAITTYDYGVSIPLPTGFFVYGPASVTTGVPPAPVPETATYAALAGLCALGLACWRRRAACRP